MKFAWAPQPGPQLAAIEARYVESLLYGGARGGGKSDFLLGDFLQDVEQYGQAWQGIMFRRSMPELEQLIARSQQIYPLTGAEWKEAKKTWLWPSGASLKMRFIENSRDAGRYQGHEYTWVGMDEITNWPDLISYRMLMACLRSSHGVDCKRMRVTGNPGGVGHHVVKAEFVDPAPTGYKLIEGRRMFIPSRVTDNKILLAADPGYVGRLKLVGSPELVRAWLSGDWNVVTGAYFPELTTEKHVIEPMELPKSWTRLCGFDWGSSSPFGVCWGAVSDGYVPGIPRGAIVIYREWYGASAPGVGLKLKNEEIAAGIKAREHEKISYRVADPAIFAEQGGPSISEVMHREDVSFRPADNARVPGWSQLRSRIQGQDGNPMILFFSTCTETIRTLATLQRDEKRPEDVDTDTDDHLGDVVRYMCMSRPYTRPMQQPPGQPRGLENMTFNELLKQNQKVTHRKNRI